MKRLLLIGPYTSTGGVSVHIRRLVRILEGEFIVSVIDESRAPEADGMTYNIRRDKWKLWRYIGMIWNSDIVHIHSGIFPLRLLHLLVARVFGKVVIVTVHSLTTVHGFHSFILLQCVLRLADQLIFVSDEIAQRVGLEGQVIPAFICPDMTQEKELPKDITELLDVNRSKRIIVSNAFRITVYNGEDLYGIDTLMELSRMIKMDNLNIKVIVVIASLDCNKEIYHKYSRQIIVEGLSEFITLVPYSISFVRLIERSDLVIRATNTDGDALTIREALFLNKPVIASDVVKRPEGTIVFRCRDCRDMYEKVKATLSGQARTCPGIELDYKAKYRAIYLS